MTDHFIYNRERDMGLKPTKHAVINDKGYYFDPEAGCADTFNRSYKGKGFQVMLVFNPDRKPMEYLLFENNEPVYASTKIEDIACRADIMIFANKQEQS